MRAGSKIIRHSTAYLKRIGGKEEASFEMSASIAIGKSLQTSGLQYGKETYQTRCRVVLSMIPHIRKTKDYGR